MKSIIVSMFAAAGLMVAGSVFANDIPENMQAVIKANGFGCTACHQVGKKVIGPAWEDVSKFYNGKMEKSPSGKTVKEATGGKTAEEWLVEKVSKGGKGNWGTMAMTPNDPSGAKKDGIKKMVELILGLAK